MLDGLEQTLTARFAAEKDCLVAILFGSCASGKARPASDVDLAVLMRGGPLSPDARLGLMDDLSRLAGRPVDLVDLSSARGLLLKEVLCKGRVLLKRDPTAFVNLVLRMLYEQADFQPLVDRMLADRQRRFVNG